MRIKFYFKIYALNNDRAHHGYIYCQKDMSVRKLETLTWTLNFFQIQNSIVNQWLEIFQ